jgi:hypothetical protein
MSKENLAVPAAAQPVFSCFTLSRRRWARATYNPNASIGQKESEETHDWC